MEKIQLQIDKEFEKLIPPLTDEEYILLHESVNQNGCLDPIIVWDGLIIDGHNRYSICHLLNIAFTVKEIPLNSREEAKLWIIQHQIGKRNLETVQKIELALKMKSLIAEQAKANQRAAGGAVPTKVTEPIDTREKLAKIAGVSPTQISKWEKIAAEACEEDLIRVRSGDTTINALYKKVDTTEKKSDQSLDTAEEKQLCALLKEIVSGVRKLSEMPREDLSSSKEQLNVIISTLTAIIRDAA